MLTLKKVQNRHKNESALVGNEHATAIWELGLRYASDRNLSSVNSCNKAYALGHLIMFN